MLICPAFGWDELCSHRSLARFASGAAGAGHVALRIDLPGTGDSGGSPRDAGLLDAWCATVAGAAAWLGERQGCERLVGFGIGLGGLLAVRALSDGAAIDDLILWSVPARGRTLMRELRAFARMAAVPGPAADYEVVPEPVAGEEIAGFLVSAETRGALESIDLTAHEIPDPVRHRVLLMGRDGLAPDAALHRHLTAAGTDVSLGDGTGYATMMTHPQFARTPQPAFDRALAWIAAASSPASPPAVTPVAGRTGATDACELMVGAERICERPFDVMHGSTRLTGVLSEPVSSAQAAVCAVLLNAGAIRRVGPNRMWVERARAWASRGVPTLRLDIEGTGDSDGDETLLVDTPAFYRPELPAEVGSALDALSAEGLPNRFALGGLCSGAHWSFQTAVADERVRGLLMINPWFFFWTDQINSQRDARQARAMLKEGRWREVLEVAFTDGRIKRMARTQVRSLVDRARHVEAPRAADDVDAVLDRLRDRGVRILMALSEGEAMTDFLRDTGRAQQLGRWPNLELMRIPIADHIFRPLWAQQLVTDGLDRALEMILAAATPTATLMG